MLGRRLLELWPALAATHLFDELRRTDQVGGAWDDTIDRSEAHGLPLTTGQTQIRIVRVGTRLVLHWRPAPDPTE